MRIIGLNGSPRAQWNTAQMVESALDGARDAGAQTKKYDLYKLTFKGCSSCFECKRLDYPSFGKCAMEDALTPVLNDVLSADGIVLGSPIYFGDLTACVRAFLERLWFAGLAYNSDYTAVYERRIPVRLIFTMNAPIENFHRQLNESVASTMRNFIGETEILEATDTLQFDDYARYETSVFNVAAKLRRHMNVFPEDLKKAYKVGRDLVSVARKENPV
ncbi:MAG: flavodoxin family protein [Oscillospiraceae bacterium]|nr:flavodoxin family protein [Oscillospiraceae bacterium]